MNRYLLNISYIGTNFRVVEKDCVIVYFSGIQKSLNKLDDSRLDYSTIQSCIELALQKFLPRIDIQTVLSSRTDAGVHALHSTLHFDLIRRGELPYNTSTLTGCLNRTLDKNKLPIRVLSSQIVPETFHCRYSAKARTYLYRFAVAKDGIISSDSKRKEYDCFIPIEEFDRCFFLQTAKFDIEHLRNASRMFLGRHDFRTFMSTSRQNSPSRDNPMFTVRYISEINIVPGKSLAIGANAEQADRLYNYWNIEVTAKSFIYKQVRRMVGTLLALATGRIDEKCIYDMLRVPSKHSWNPRIALAPACGLYLRRVHYNPEDFEVKFARMSFLQQLQNRRAMLKNTSTIITTPTGERFIENQRDSTQIVKLSERSFGFVIDTMPDKVPSCILSDFLYLGSQDAVSSENVGKYQLTHILSIGVEMPELQQNDTENIFIPCLDLPSTILFHSIQKAVKFIKKARSIEGRILVHCNAGVSRSASIVIAYLILEWGMSYAAAFTLVKSKRECVQPNCGFIMQLKNCSQMEY